MPMFQSSDIKDWLHKIWCDILKKKPEHPYLFSSVILMHKQLGDLHIYIFNIVLSHWGFLPNISWVTWL